MKRAILFGAICLMAIEATAQLSFGTPEKINKDWMFTLENPINAQSKELNLSDWKAIDLPHDWSIREQLSPNLASSTGYLPGGIGWYRKSIDIPTHKQDQKVYLYFEGVYNRSELFVNGTSIGKRPNGYISFMYDITPYVTFGETTQIAMKVDHSQSADSRWYTGSGIYRDAWIVYANPIHIAQWGVYAQPKRVTTKEATLQVEVEVSNNSKSKGKIIVTNELYSSNNKVVAKNSNSLSIESGANSTTISDLKVSNPQLWDIDNPNLYKLKTTITRDGKIIDQTTTNTGFRTYEFDPNRGFALNGKWTKVKGVCIHHDAGVLGSAVPKEVWKRRLINLKRLGVNAIRTSHNPQATALYELCDELGLLVMNEAFDEWEFPKRKWIEGWNRGTPGYQGSYDYFEEWAERDLADMVRRDRNHTSIFAWSIGNEVDYPNDPYSHPVLAGGSNTGFTQPIFGGYKSDAPDAMRLGDIAKRLTAVVKEYDTSRPVTAGLAGVAMSNQTEYPNALDIAGYNYTENRYQIDHEKYPNRIIYGSENRHEHEAWKYVRDNEHIFGQFLWTGIDYLGESGAWPSRGFYSGLLDFGGFIKPRGFFRQSLWSSE
ncbi:MAG: sugar-binding domain-containing protein, partial [Bacteroidales bacterium]